MRGTLFAAVGLIVSGSACAIDGADDDATGTTGTTEQDISGWAPGSWGTTTDLVGFDTGWPTSSTVCVMTGVDGNLGEGGYWEVMDEPSVAAIEWTATNWRVIAHGGAYTNQVNQRVWANNPVNVATVCIPYPATRVRARRVHRLPDDRRRMGVCVRRRHVHDDGRRRQPTEDVWPDGGVRRLQREQLDERRQSELARLAGRKLVDDRVGEQVRRGELHRVAPARSVRGTTLGCDAEHATETRPGNESLSHEAKFDLYLFVKQTRCGGTQREAICVRVSRSCLADRWFGVTRCRDCGLESVAALGDQVWRKTAAGPARSG